jgi:hypothetical protein
MGHGNHLHSSGMTMSDRGNRFTDTEAARPKVPARAAAVATWAVAAERPGDPFPSLDASPEWAHGSGPTLRRGWVRRKDGARCIEVADAIIDESNPLFAGIWDRGCEGE